jgi:hypothetical protein
MPVKRVIKSFYFSLPDVSEFLHNVELSINMLRVVKCCVGFVEIFKEPLEVD